MWSVLAKRGLREIDAGLESLLLHSFNKKSLHKCFTLKKKIHLITVRSLISSPF